MWEPTHERDRVLQRAPGGAYASSRSRICDLKDWAFQNESLEEPSRLLPKTPLRCDMDAKPVPRLRARSAGAERLSQEPKRLLQMEGDR